MRDFVSLYRPDTKLLPPAGRRAVVDGIRICPLRALVGYGPLLRAHHRRQHTGWEKTLHLPFSSCGFVKRPRRSDPRNAERAVVQMIQKSLMIQCEKGRSKDRRREVNSVPKMALTRQMQGEKSTVDLADIQAQRKKRCMAKSQAFLQSWTRDPAFLRSGQLSGSQPSAGPIGLPRKLGT